MWLLLVNCRHEDEDVLNIQPPQIQAQPRKEKHRRRHKEGRKKGKEDRYANDVDDRHSSRKSERPLGIIVPVSFYLMGSENLVQNNLLLFICNDLNCSDSQYSSLSLPIYCHWRAHPSNL